MIVRSGPNRNNGAWFHSKAMWVQNEDTSSLPSIVDRRTYQELIAGALTQPKSPEESLASMKARPGFKVELVAGEPLIESPVAFEWGADGKLWVVEMVDYPLGLDGKGKRGGVVRFLEDETEGFHLRPTRRNGLDSDGCFRWMRHPQELRWLFIFGRPAFFAYRRSGDLINDRFDRRCFFFVNRRWRFAATRFGPAIRC